MPAPTHKKVWRVAGRELPLDGRPLAMGVVNVTPDSFSDGGRWLDPDKAVAHGLDLVRQGADILDIGGESTRPGAEPVAPEEEARRVVPVIRRLVAEAPVPVSVDTRHPEVARQALAAGASIINDVAPFAGDAAMAAAVREAGAGLVVMHARGNPQTMAALTGYADIAAEIESSLAEALTFAESRGLARESVVIDPGIGFAKDTEENLAALAATERLSRLAPVLIGVSRKRFIGELCREPEAALRDGGSVGAAVWCALHGASVLRVHAVRETVQALAVALAISRAMR